MKTWHWFAIAAAALLLVWFYRRKMAGPSGIVYTGLGPVQVPPSAVPIITPPPPGVTSTVPPDAPQPLPSDLSGSVVLNAGTSLGGYIPVGKSFPGGYPIRVPLGVA